MAVNKKFSILIEAILCSFGFMIFSYFIHYKLPISLISVAALMIPSYFISRNLHSLSDLNKVTGKSSSLKLNILYCSVGFLSGILIAVFYRWYLGMSLVPVSLHYFVIAAAIIGSLEELVFRGYIQGSVSSISTTFSIFFSTISHTGYKCCLFLSPMAAAGIDIGLLAFWTFIFGLLFGTIRHFSNSIFPSLIAHALFDILVYAEYVNAPWWVW